MNANKSLRSLAILGGGVVALTAALRFARSFPELVITLIPCRIEPGAFSDQFPVVLAEMSHAADGLLTSPEAALQYCAPRYASQFSDWGAPSFLVAPGAPAAPSGPGAVHQRWLRAAAAGCELPAFHTLFPAAALSPFNADGSHEDVDLCFDSRRLTDHLLHELSAIGIRPVPATVRKIERTEHGDVAALRLTDDQRIDADLFIDASGPEAMLADPVACEAEDWLNVLPIDRVLVRAATETRGRDSYRAVAEGWQAEWSLPGGGVSLYGFSSRYTDEADARVIFGKRAEVATIAPGQRKSWCGNCIALGEASIQPGPLGRMGFTIALTQIELAVELCPGREPPVALIAEYNRRVAEYAASVRDWLAAHYLAMRPLPGRFWKDIATHSPSASLAQSLQQFRRRGHLPYRNEDGISPERWRQLLIGLGERPESSAPAVMAVAPEDLAASLHMAAQMLRTPMPKKGPTR